MNIVHPNANKNNSGGQRIVDWSALRQELPGSEGIPRGYCESCRLFLWSDGGLKVPGLRGMYCCVLCLECELFGPGRCRWCSAPLESTAKKFCDGHCRKQSDRTRFGGGDRLLNFLSHQYPALYEQLIGKVGHVCVNCLGPLDGKNAGARFCSTACKMRFRRRTVQSRNCQKSGKKRNTNSIKSNTYEGSKTGVVLTHAQARKAVEIEGVSV